MVSSIAKSVATQNMGGCQLNPVIPSATSSEPEPTAPPMSPTSSELNGEQSGAPKKRRRGSAKKAFDAFMLGRRVARRPGLFIPKLSFERLVHQIIARHRPDLRIQQEALDVLQETAEAMIVDRFEKCARVAELCRKDTVRREHWRHVQAQEDAIAGGAGALPYSGRS